MSVALARADVQRFRELIAERLGLQFEDAKLDFLAEVLRERMAVSASEGCASYLERLTSPAAARDELGPVTQQLTVPETYFLRNASQFQALAEVVIPERIRVRSGQRELRILSAGCASGDEAYSIAIVLRDQFPELASWQVTIQGIDVNGAMLRKAAQARYSAWSLRETPPDVRSRWFRMDGREFVLDESIQRMVAFEERNLVTEDRGFWRPGAFDVVFCRNVLMYFTPSVIRAVVSRIARALAPGGFLFLGHAETLRGVSQEFHLCHTHETFYYQRREPAELERAAVLQGVPAAGAFSSVVGREAPPVELDPTESWVETIHRASERIAALARSPGARPTRPAASGNGPASRRDGKVHGRQGPARSGGGSVSSGGDAPARGSGARPDLGIARELLRRERFAEAMQVLRALPPEAQADPDAQLLHAVGLTNSGSLAEAEEVCRRLLAADELNAGARYIMALCREHAGDPAAAAEHDQAAAYLDPAFAMPHFHLGLLAKRAGDLETARRELGEAYIGLAGEDASRILLFGGGFSREALVKLCAHELRACGAGA